MSRTRRERPPSRSSPSSPTGLPRRGDVRSGGVDSYEMLDPRLPLTYPDGSTEPLVIACPVTARSMRSASRPPSPRRVRAPLHRGGFREAPGAHKGFIGPEGLGRFCVEIRYLVDPRVVPGTSWVAGAGRRTSTSTTSSSVGTSPPTAPSRPREVHDGDPAPDGSGPMRLTRGMEMGHILPAGPEVRRGARSQGARRQRQDRRSSRWAPTASA